MPPSSDVSNLYPSSYPVRARPPLNIRLETFRFVPSLSIKIMQSSFQFGPDVDVYMPGISSLGATSVASTDSNIITIKGQSVLSFLVLHNPASINIPSSFSLILYSAHLTVLQSLTPNHWNQANHHFLAHSFSLILDNSLETRFPSSPTL